MLDNGTTDLHSCRDIPCQNFDTLDLLMILGSDGGSYQNQVGLTY